VAKDWEDLAWSDLGLPTDVFAADNNMAARISNGGRIRQSEPTGPGSTRADVMSGSGNPEKGS
jgi:hypothetical protein